MSAEVLLARVSQAIAASLAAGVEIMAVYQGDHGVSFKADQSPLTQADKRAHDVIVAALSSTGLPLLSEEGSSVPHSVRQRWSHYWLVDPLDGTREFIKRNGEFTVNIALMQRNEIDLDTTDHAYPVLGVLFAPATSTLYFAWQGGGAYRQQGVSTSDTTPAYPRSLMSDHLPVIHARSPYTILASRSHRDPHTEAFIQQKEKEHGAVTTCGIGSALKFGLMAEGAADVYPRYAPTMEWDTAAGQIICEETGLQVIDLKTGAPLRYNKNELVNGPFTVS